VPYGRHRAGAVSYELGAPVRPMVMYGLGFRPSCGTVLGFVLQGYLAYTRVPRVQNDVTQEKQRIRPLRFSNWGTPITILERNFHPQSTSFRKAFLQDIFQ